MIYQKFLLCIFIVGQSYRTAKAISDELKNFQKSFEETRDEMQGIKNTLGVKEDDNLQRQRRRTIDELLANFQQDPNMFEDFEDGEDWYREFRAREAAQNGRSDDDWEAFKLSEPDNSADLIAADNNQAFNEANNYNNFNGLSYNFNNNYKNDEAQHDFNDNYNYFNADGSNFNVNDILGNSFKVADIDKRSSNNMKRSRNGLHSLFQKSNYNRNNYPNNYPINNNDYLKDFVDSRTTFDNLKERQRSSSNLRDGEFLNSNELNSPITYEQTIENINFPSISNDQFDINKNDLSHEANYKLSKIEQDAAEKDKDKEYPLCNEDQTTNTKKVLTDSGGSSSNGGTSSSGGSGSNGGSGGSGTCSTGGLGSGSSSGSSSGGSSSGSTGSEAVSSTEPGTCDPDSITEAPCTEMMASSTDSSSGGMDFSSGSACGSATSGSTGGGSGSNAGSGSNSGSNDGSGSIGSSKGNGSNGSSGSGSNNGSGSGSSNGSSSSSGSASSNASGSNSGSGSSNASGSSNGSGSSSGSGASSSGSEPPITSIEAPVCKPPTLGSKSQFNFKIKNNGNQQYGNKQQSPTTSDPYSTGSSSTKPSSKPNPTSSNGVSGKSKGKCKSKVSRKSWKTGDLTKRSYNFNPMNEIKLKTSRRLMRKGFGASLPSYSLVDTQRELKLDELMQRMENGDKGTEDRKTDIFSKLDALMNGNGRTSDNRGNTDGGGYPYGDRTNRMTDLRIGVLNNVGEETGANDADDGQYLDVDGDYTRIKRITNQDKEDINSKLIEAMLQQSEAEEEARSRTKRSVSEKPPNVCNTKLNAAGKKVPAACIGPQKTVISFGLKEAGADMDDEKKPKEKSHKKPKLNHSANEKGLQLNLHKRNALQADIDHATDKRAKHRRRLMPNECEETVGSNQLSRAKRFTRVEDEIFNDDANEDIEMGDPEARVRVKRALVDVVADQNNTSTLSTIDQSTISLTLPYSNLNQTKVNSTESHKMQKRETYIDDNYLDGNNEISQAMSSEHNVVVREDDYDDMAARRKRLIEKNFDFGAAMRPFGNEKFDNLQQKDPELDKLLGSKFDNEWYADEAHHPNIVNTMKSDNAASSVNNHNAVNTANALNSINSANTANSKINHSSKRYKEKVQKAAVKKNYEIHPKESKSGSTNIDGNNNNNSNKKTMKGTTTDKHANEVSITTSEAKDADRKLVLSLRDEILNSTAFTQLENLLKNYKRISDNSDANTGNLVKSDHNAAVAPENNNNTGNNGTICEEKMFTMKASPPSSETIAIEGSASKKDDRMKLNITINASVMGDEKTNNFVGNGTINVRPGFAEDRERRSSMFPEFDFYDAIEKRKCKQDEMKSCKEKKKGEKDRCREKGRQKGREKERAKERAKEKQAEKEKENCKNDEEECSLDSVISGKVSSDVVRNAFGLVRKNPKLKVLWPSLQRNKPAQKPSEKTDKKQELSALRAHESDAAVRRTEEMMHQVMKCINGLIEKQLRSKSCLPLPPDLADFYELILKTYEAQEKQRKKRENKTRSLATDFSKAVRAIDPNVVEEKSRIVKKLLRQYDDLPLEDQKQATNMRDDLLLDLVYLRKLKTSQDMLEERRKRELLEDQFNTQPIDEEIWRKFEKKYTPAFLKILKTADLFKETAADT